MKLRMIDNSRFIIGMELSLNPKQSISTWRASFRHQYNFSITYQMIFAFLCSLVCLPLAPHLLFWLDGMSYQKAYQR